MQRAPQLAARERAIGLGRAAARPCRVERADGIQRRIVPRYARKVELDQLASRDAARADRSRKLGSAGERIDPLV
jgi:hypothetical protein